MACRAVLDVLRDLARGTPPRAAAARSHRQAHQEGRRRPTIRTPAAALADQEPAARAARADARSPERRADLERAPPATAARAFAPAETAEGQPCRYRRCRSPIRNRCQGSGRTPQGRVHAAAARAARRAARPSARSTSASSWTGARLLEEKCREFAVEGTVVQIHPGPVVTTFEFKPDAGVKYAKITGLADDLCLAMQAESVLDRSHSRQVHRRHPDSEPQPRADLAPRAPRIGASIGALRRS